MKKYVIGKADKFFTLWTKCDGSDGTAVYTYVKNISENLETARDRYPGAEYLGWLRGKGRWSVSDHDPLIRVHEVGVLYFGKHAGKRLTEIPIDYIEWLYNNCDTYSYSPYEIVWWDESRKMMEEILTSSGYEIFKMKYNSLAVKSDDVKDGPSVEKSLLAGKIFSVHVDRNLSEYGIVVIDGLFLVFPEHRKYTYHDFLYSLPLKDGKAKRIKNKTVEITDYEIEEHGPHTCAGKYWRRAYVVTVKDFNVLKNT